MIRPLQRRFWLLAALGVLAALTAAFSFVQLRAASAPTLHGTALDNPPLVEPFELTNASGERVTLEAWRGELLLVFFGFTTCPDVCPLTLGRLAKVYEDLGEPKDVQVVMITVDPEHDTPEVTQRYAAGFHPDFVGLGGSTADIAEAAKRFYIGYRELDERSFLHTDTVALLDREGRLRLVYAQDNVARIGSDVATILAQRRW